LDSVTKEFLRITKDLKQEEKHYMDDKNAKYKEIAREK